MSKYVRTSYGELMTPYAAKQFKKPYPLPAELKAVAVEIMGGEDPLNLSPEERERRMAKFFNIALDYTNKR